MNRNNLLYTVLGLVVLLWVLDFIALTFYFYWTVGWYDYLMHFLGGVILGVLIIWIFRLRNISPTFLTIFTLAVVVGGAWEIFEYINDITLSTQDYPIDTLTDLVMDALGAGFAYWWATSPCLVQAG